MSKSI